MNTPAMSTPKEGVCCLCGGEYHDYGHNPEPLGNLETERCCSDCNAMYVLSARGVGAIDPDTAPEKVVRRFLKYLYARAAQHKQNR